MTMPPLRYLAAMTTKNGFVEPVLQFLIIRPDIRRYTPSINGWLTSHNRCSQS
jgi:hypothetical protein